MPNVNGCGELWCQLWANVGKISWDAPSLSNGLKIEIVEITLN